jgi:hypothetical protein
MIAKPTAQQQSSFIPIPFHTAWASFDQNAPHQKRSDQHIENARALISNQNALNQRHAAAKSGNLEI